jgi:hypothetical protein
MCVVSLADGIPKPSRHCNICVNSVLRKEEGGVGGGGGGSQLIVNSFNAQINLSA